MILFLSEQRATMRNLLAFLAAAGLTVLGAGYYLGWYSVVSTTGASGHRNVNIDINTKKIGHDLEEGASRVQKALDKAGDKAAEQAGQQVQQPPINNGQMALPPSPHDHAPNAGTPVSTTNPQFRSFGQ
jgi:hypothetical protein